MSRSAKAALKEAKLKREPGGFAALPFTLLRSRSFAVLTPYAVKLLFDLVAQYNLRNNGDLSIAFEKVMRPRGWKSKDTLNKARLELVNAGFVVLTRQGGLHQCSLYGLTFYAIDHCDGKLEICATRTPMGGWYKDEPIRVERSSTPAVLNRAQLGTSAVL